MSTVPATSELAAKADRVRRDMRCIRRELGDNVEELVENAERLMDWRYYVTRYPWATVGAAALIGYFLVPRRIVTLPTDQHSLTQLVDRIAPALSPPEKEKPQPGWFSSLISMGTGMLLRAAAGYAAQQVSKAFAPPAPEPQPVETHHA